MGLLVLNAGSSGLKFTLLDDEGRSTLVDGEIAHQGPGPAKLIVKIPGRPDRREPCQAATSGEAASLAIRVATEGGGTIRAIGHRVVHGGPRFVEGVLITPDLEAELAKLTELAPLHNPPALEAIEAAKRARPDVPQVAAFDTSFFAHLPRAAATYAVPHEWVEKYGIRRYGFHGLSHAYCAGEAARLLGRDPAGLRLVVCHLGNGASASAIRGGKPLDTTMGFTPLPGLVMGTRPGEVDPGILLYLMKVKGLTPDDLDDALNHHSGLLGVSGVSADFREVEEAAKGGDDRAKLALEVDAARLRSSLGALAATLGGLDAVVFAGGIGEHSASLRAAACEGLGFLGLRLDPARNDGAAPGSDVAEDDSPARILVIHTREDLMIAREILRLVPMA